MTNAELLAEIERRSILVYRDGRHYVPLFVTGDAKDERRATISVLRGVEAARDVIRKRLNFDGPCGHKIAVSSCVTCELRRALAALSEVTP